MPTSPRSVNALIYGRVSLDKQDSTSVAQQKHEGRKCLAEPPDASPNRTWQLLAKGLYANASSKEPPKVLAEGIYADDGISASPHGAYRDEQRVAFPALWERIKSPTEQVDVIIVWAISRLSRTLTEGSQFLDDCASRDIKWYVMSDDDIYDLRNPKWRERAQDEFQKAEKASNTTAKDVARGVRQLREKGFQPGICPYGYTRLYDPLTGKKTSQVVNNDEAAIVREVFGLAAAGASLATMAQRLNKRGVPPPSGDNTNGWVVATLYNGTSRAGILTNPVYISKILVKPLAAGRTGGQRDLTPSGLMNCGTDEAGQPAYPRIVDDDTWWSAVHNLTAREPRRWGAAAADDERREQGREWVPRPGSRTHLLTGIATCGACGSVVVVGNKVYYQSHRPLGPHRTGTVFARDGAWTGAVSLGTDPDTGKRVRKTVRAKTEAECRQLVDDIIEQHRPPERTPEQMGMVYYRCKGRIGTGPHAHVQEIAADQHVRALVIDKLCDVTQGVLSGSAAQDAAELQKQKDDIEADLAEAEALYNLGLGKGGISGKQFVAKQDACIAQMLAIDAELEALRLPAGTVRQFMPDKGDRKKIIQRWDGLPIEAQSAVVRDLAESMVFKPAKHAGNGQEPVSERIKITWKPSMAPPACMGPGSSLRPGRMSDPIGSAWARSTSSSPAPASGCSGG